MRVIVGVPSPTSADGDAVTLAVPVRAGLPVGDGVTVGVPVPTPAGGDAVTLAVPVRAGLPVGDGVTVSGMGVTVTGRRVGSTICVGVGGSVGVGCGVELGSVAIVTVPVGKTMGTGGDPIVSSG